MDIFNLVFHILGATRRIWFTPSGRDGAAAGAGCGVRARQQRARPPGCGRQRPLAHTCLTPWRLQRKPEEREADRAGLRREPPHSPHPAGWARRPGPCQLLLRTKWPPGPGSIWNRGGRGENGRRSGDVIRWCSCQKRPGTGRFHACGPQRGPGGPQGPARGLLRPDIPTHRRRAPREPPDAPSPA